MISDGKRVYGQITICLRDVHERPLHNTFNCACIYNYTTKIQEMEYIFATFCIEFYKIL